MAVLSWTAILLGVLFCLQGNQAFADGKFFFSTIFSFTRRCMFSHDARDYCARIFDYYYAAVIALFVVVAMKNSCCLRGT